MRVVLTVAGMVSIATGLALFSCIVALVVRHRYVTLKLRAEIDAEFMRVVERVVVPRPGTKGIVIPAGGKYMAEAYASIKVLREAGCELPICIVHAGPDEVTEKERALFTEAFGTSVFFRDAEDYDFGVEPTKLWGFEIKPYALLLSPFEHTILLDADCSSLGLDIEPLFDEPAYRAYGNIFWPDFSVSDKLIRPWMVGPFAKGQVPAGFETESGQMVVNVRKCLRGIIYAWLLNKHSDVFYSNYYGDKDLFRVGWVMAGLPYCQGPSGPGMAGHVDGNGQFVMNTIIQKHPSLGVPLFAHRNMHKHRRTWMKNSEIAWDAYVPNDGEYGARAIIQWDTTRSWTPTCLPDLCGQRRPSPARWGRILKMLQREEDSFMARSES